MLSSRPISFGPENQVYPMKTPRRAKNRAENDVPMTKGPGKNNLKESALRTPFRPDAQPIQKGSVANTTHGKSIMVVPRTVSRPLGDKTPFPNRTQTHQFETPVPQTLKPQVLSFLESQPQIQPVKTPESQLRPSSGRKQDRVPRSSSKNFETPVNNGNYWDVSDLSIVMPEAPIKENEPEEDYDEIEYMPPNTLNLEYRPPLDFELPDYKEVGKTLFNLAHSYPCEDVPVAEIEIDENDMQLPGWDMLSLPELENDDPFVTAAEPKKPVKATVGKPAASLSREKVKLELRSTKSATVSRAPSVMAKSNTTAPSRPGTSTLVTRPAKLLDNQKKDVSVRKGVRPPVAVGRPQVNDKAKVITSTRPPVPSLRSATSAATTLRPASAATTRSRTTTTVQAAISTRRPATSTSSYRATPAVHLSSPLITSSKKASAVIKDRRDRAPTDKADQGFGDMILFIEPQVPFDDDFKFDV